MTGLKTICYILFSSNWIYRKHLSNKICCNMVLLRYTCTNLRIFQSRHCKMNFNCITQGSKLLNCECPCALTQCTFLLAECRMCVGTYYSLVRTFNGNYKSLLWCNSTDVTCNNIVINKELWTDVWYCAAQCAAQMFVSVDSLERTTTKIHSYARTF